MFGNELRMPGARAVDKTVQNGIAAASNKGRADGTQHFHLPGLLGMRRTLSGSDLGRHQAQPSAPLRNMRDSLKPDPTSLMGTTKGGLRQWIRFDKRGETTVIQADKHYLQQQLGVQARDMRLLDPMLNSSYPSAILCRDKALVCNLEHIKCIISTDYVLVLNAGKPNDGPLPLEFVQELQRRITPEGGRGGYNPSAPNLQSMGAATTGARTNADTRANTSMLRDAMADQGMEPPFELRVLEIALDVVSAHLETSCQQLESLATLALDKLTEQVTTSNLERVRSCKTRLVRLVTRVETLREVLEKFLDDDSDMHAMHLTARVLDQLERKNSFLQQQDRPAMVGHARTSAGSTGSAGGVVTESTSPHVQTVFSPLEYLEEEKERDEGEVAEVEMVLETYFMHIDNTYNKLQTLAEYIDDTEDYINIELDNHRNQLIRLELLLTAATFSVAVVGGISGILE
eukprot:jgi/Botrbrau1/17805/Bobra.0127s0054.1